MANENINDRNKLRNNPHSVLKYIAKDVDIVVKTNTKTTIHMVFPSIEDLDTQELTQLQAATATASSVSTVGTASSIGSVTATASTVGSGSSIGSVGSTG